MKIVIDIPKEMYDWLLDVTNTEDDERRLIYIRDNLALSTPLPKGHGRLIEAVPLIVNLWKDKLDSRELISEMITNAPTIIEAESEVADADNN